MIGVFCNISSTARVYPLSLHDALPISAQPGVHFPDQDLARRRKVAGGGEPPTLKVSESHGITLTQLAGVLQRDTPASDEQVQRSEEHTSELQSRGDRVCRLLIENKKKY